MIAIRLKSVDNIDNDIIMYPQLIPQPIRVQPMYSNSCYTSGLRASPHHLPYENKRTVRRQSIVSNDPSNIIESLINRAIDNPNEILSSFTNLLGANSSSNNEHVEQTGDEYEYKEDDGVRISDDQDGISIVEQIG